MKLLSKINTNNLSVSFSLLGSDPTKLRVNAANELVAYLESARAGYVNKAQHQNGTALYTSSDAARFIAKNETYNKLTVDIEDKNKALKDDLNLYVNNKITDSGIDISDLPGVMSGKLSLFDNPAIEMAGNALGAEMGIIDTMTVNGMPENKYNWTENLTVIIDQYPDYLYHDEDFDFRNEYGLVNEMSQNIIYPLGVKNTCVFSTGIAEDIADAIEESTDPIKTATSQMVSKSISDLNTEANSLMKNLSAQSATFDTGALNNTLLSFEQVYSEQMKTQIPGKIAEEVAADPVVSGWITSTKVELIASNYLSVLSNKEIINQSSNDTLSNEISSRIRMQITGLDHPVSDDEMDAVLHRVDTDVRVGVAEGISVVIIDNSGTIDMYFNETNAILQSMLDDAMTDATDDFSDAVSKQVSKRLKKTMGMVPAGLPVIPPNWVFTINVWTYDVVGKYQTFRVIDNDNEVIFDPYFGHVGQVYVRQKETVLHPCKKGEDGLALRIGENKPILFNFNGYAATVVGTGPKGVGDKTGGRTEESEGYSDMLIELRG